MNLVKIIAEVAKVPSFSTFEERLHPFIVDFISDINGAEVVEIKDNNILVKIEGDNGRKAVAITSHLDKINHFGEHFPDVLKAEYDSREIMGQMDNSVGVGICLHLAKMAANESFPPLMLLFSEMEESSGLKHHPHLLKNNGRDVGPQIGAKRLSQYIEENSLHPAAFITVDTSPVFKGEPGVALYTEYWENSDCEPNEVILKKINSIKDFVLAHDPEVRLANGTNDYLVYGRHFSKPEQGNIPSIALEPAIYPYHQIGERVFIDDVKRIVALLSEMLKCFDFSYSKG